MRGRHGQVEVGVGCLGRVMLGLPFALQHQGEAVDQHIQKAAYHQAQQCGQHPGGKIQGIGHHVLKDLTQTEDGQIHGH